MSREAGEALIGEVAADNMSPVNFTRVSNK